MADDLETLSKEQLTCLAQYFDERVSYPPKYKQFRVTLLRQALPGLHASITHLTRTSSPRRPSLSSGHLSSTRIERRRVSVPVCSGKPGGEASGRMMGVAYASPWPGGSRGREVMALGKQRLLSCP